MQSANQNSQNRRIAVALQTRLLSAGLAVLAGSLYANAARADWGENWGSMIWGFPSVPVPVFGGGALILLATLLLGMALPTIARRRGMRLPLVMLLALAGPLTAYAATMAMPNVFVNGMVADANEVNANFDTVVIESNDQDARIAALETLIATLQSSVAANAGAIATNTASVATNTANIAANTAGIATNMTGVAANTAGIATNTTNVGTLSATFAGVGRLGSLLTFSGMNVQVVDGSGDTAGAVNGLGNLIIGYNEDTYGTGRTGSHNLVIGQDHDYSGFAGLVAGHRNWISGNAASITGGSYGQASGDYSSISGGFDNRAIGTNSSVEGGGNNQAIGNFSSISGGGANTTNSNSSSIGGGNGTVVSGSYGWAAGGASLASNLFTFSGMNVQLLSGSGSTNGAVNGLGNLVIGYNENTSGAVRTGSHNLVVGREHTYTSFAGLVAGFRNTISGDASSITGGNYNSASGYHSVVVGGAVNVASGDYSNLIGGAGNEASAPYSSVSGGYYNAAASSYSNVSGGYSNTTSGSYSSVSGGANNTASGNYSSVSGGASRSVSGTYDWRAGTLFETQ